MAVSSSAQEEALVVAFETTASALALAAVASQHGLSGRLIPVPRSLSAGCGMAWREPLDHIDNLESALADECIDDFRMVRMRLP